jgi:hypothetical protein
MTMGDCCIRENGAGYRLTGMVALETRITEGIAVQEGMTFSQVVASHINQAPCQR